MSRCWQHGTDNCPQCEAEQLTQDRGDRHSQFQAFALFVGMAVAAIAFFGFVCVYALRTLPLAPRAVADGVSSLGPRLATLVEREPVKKTVGTPSIDTVPLSVPRDDRHDSDSPIVVYNIGKDVTSPVVVYNPQPKYTLNALQRKVQGTVVMTAVVLPDGRVTNVAVVRSLDRYSLDDVARTTAARWRFRPGMRQGVPVAVRVRIELEFKLRE